MIFCDNFPHEDCENPSEIEKFNMYKSLSNEITYFRIFMEAKRKFARNPNFPHIFFHNIYKVVHRKTQNNPVQGVKCESIRMRSVSSAVFRTLIETNKIFYTLINYKILR